MEVFEIFIIRYINYINIWSIELTNENFYEEFKDGILLVNLLKQWSSLYGYNNTEGDLIIYKRPLSRSQALLNINLCINFIVNPPEKSKLPEYLNREKELIKAEEIYDMDEASVIRFINNIFHHYLIPYLRVNSKSILDNVNKYLMLHGLSLSDETMQSFYKMIIKGNTRQIKDDEFLERVESWEQYMSLNMKEMEESEENRGHLARHNDDDCSNLTGEYDYSYVRMKQEAERKTNGRKVFEPKYINPLQCDVTSNGFMLIMVMLYQMGWIDTAILCQMYYIPKTLEEFRWNHEIVYYSFQTINNYLNIQKELSIIGHNSSGKKYGSIFLDSESGNQVEDSLISSEIPFILLPLSSLYMENFSPYVLLLQIDILYNLLTQQIDSNYDVTSLSSSHLAVYGPYQPINLELLDELTYRDNYPLNWTMGKCSNLLNPGNALERVEYQEGYEMESGDNDQEDVDSGLNANNFRGDSMGHSALISDDNLVRMDAIISGSNLNYSNIREEAEVAMNDSKQDDGGGGGGGDDDDYVVGSMYEYLQNRENDIHKETQMGNLYDDETEYDIGYEDHKGSVGKNSENRLQRNDVEIQEEGGIRNGKSVNKGVDTDPHRLQSSKGEQLVGSGLDEMFTGLEKELEILKIYDKNNYSEKPVVNESAGNNIAKILQEKMTVGNGAVKELRDRFSHVLTMEGSDQSKIKPLVSRTVLEEHQKKILEMAKNDDEYASKVFDITRKQSDGVIEKISTAINENNRLLEKLKMSMNLQKSDSSQHEESRTQQVSGVSDDNKSGPGGVLANLNHSKENIGEVNNGVSVGGGVDFSLSQKVDGFKRPIISASVDTRDDLKAAVPNRSVQQKISRRKKANKVSFSDLVQMEVERAGLKG